MHTVFFQKGVLGTVNILCDFFILFFAKWGITILSSSSMFKKGEEASLLLADLKIWESSALGHVRSSS